MVCGLDRVTLTCTFELYFRQAFVHTTPHLSKKRNKTCLCAYMLHEHAQYFTFTLCGITRKRGWWLEIKHFLNASNRSVSLETLTADSVFLSTELEPGIQHATRQSPCCKRSVIETGWIACNLAGNWQKEQKYCFAKCCLIRFMWN